MKVNEKKQWLELYEIAGKIEKVKPWKYFSDMDLFVYVSPKLNDIFYCCIMGNAGLHTGLNIYQGTQIHSYLSLVNNDYPETVVFNYQDCLSCVYLSKNETMPKNLEIIKVLGLSFKNTWISFERFEKGYEPSHINISQVEILIEVLNNFYEMFSKVINDNIKIDFENGNVFTRFYNDESKEYVDIIDKLMIPERKFGTVQISKEIEKDLKKLKLTNIELEYEFLNYFPVIIEENKTKDERYAYPLIRMIIDRKSGYILDQKFINMKDYKSREDYIVDSIDYLVKFFLRFGKPRCIYVRDEEAMIALKDLLDKTNIKVKVSSKLKNIDKMLTKLNEIL